MNRREIVKYLIFAALGILIIYFIQRNFSFADFVGNLKKSHIGFVITSILTGVLAVFIRALRWQLLLEPLGYKVNLANAYHSTMSGYLVNLGIPRSGEVSRCAMLSKSDKVPINVLVGTVLSERILDLLMLALVVFLAVLTQFTLLYDYIDQQVLSRIGNNKPLLIIAIIVLLIGLVAAFNIRRILKPDTAIGKMIIGFMDGIKSVFTVKKPILFIAYTLAIWVCYWLMTYTILLAFDFSSGLGVAGGLGALVFSTLGVIIPAPAGSAAIYSIYFGLNQIYNLSIDQAKAIGIVMFSGNIIMIILAGTFSYIAMAKRMKA